MNIEEYIASGILELYVMGELSTTETSEVEKLAAQYPEIQKEIQLIQETIREVAVSSAIPPRPDLKDEILSRITTSENIQDTKVRHPLPDNASRPKEKEKAISFLQYGIAASIALAVIAMITAFYFRSQWKDAEQRLDDLLVQNQQIAAQYETAHQEVQQLTEELSVITSRDYQAIEMTGLDASPNSLAYVYWNQNSDQVYLQVNSLPPNASDKQYQLWAIVDGQPVSAGVFDVSSSQQPKLINMKSIENASAFAVTLEPRGGSEAPTLDAMYVKGAV